MTFNILTVCTGNICRSVMAEVVLREALHQAGVADIRVDSAGISDEESGNPMDYRAAEVLREAGYPLPRHHAKKVGRGQLQDYDLVLPMTAWHLQSIQNLARADGLDLENGTTKLKLFREFDPRISPEEKQNKYAGTLDVADPWYGNRQDFVETLETIELAVPQIVTAVQNQISLQN